MFQKCDFIERLMMVSTLSHIYLILIEIGTVVSCTGTLTSNSSYTDSSDCGRLISQINLAEEKFMHDMVDSPYEILAQKSYPGVYEVLIRGKHGQKISGFLLSIKGPPYGGTFSGHNGKYLNRQCDPDDPQKTTLIFSQSLNLQSNQIVTYFYPRHRQHAHGGVQFRGVVYSDSKTAWFTSNVISFPNGKNSK